MALILLITFAINPYQLNHLVPTYITTSVLMVQQFLLLKALFVRFFCYFIFPYTTHAPNHQLDRQQHFDIS